MAGSMRKAMSFLGFSSEAPTEEDGEIMEYDERIAEVTPFPGGHQTAVTRPRVVHEEVHRIVTAHPSSYRDAREIGEPYRAGIPVIMNLSETSDADAKHLVDFASGLVFALHGDLERVTSKVFLLSPEFVEVAPTSSAGGPGTDLFGQR